MPREAASAIQLPLFVSESSVAQEVLAHYEAIRPVLTGQRSLRQQSEQAGINYWRLWRDLQRFQRSGLLGLVGRRTLPHARGKPTVDTVLPRSIQQHIVRLAIAHPFTARELARIVRECYHEPIDYRGIQRVLTQHHLTSDVLQHHRVRAQEAPVPPWPLEPPLDLPFNPTAHAQRLEHALGPEHLLIRLRTYREYRTEEQARWRIIELLEVAFGRAASRCCWRSILMWSPIGRDASRRAGSWG